MIKFKQLYIDNHEKLFGYLLRKSGSAHLAADLAQETFTRYLERYKNRKQSPALLFTMGRNLFYDYLRLNKRFITYTENCQEPIPGQEENYIVKEQSDRILGAMAKLTEAERDILALVVSSGLKYQEIAEISQCSVANVKVKVHRARQNLKNILKENSDG